MLIPTLVVGSTSRHKLTAVREALTLARVTVTVLGADVPSFVPAQPVGEETLQGARNRARGAQKTTAQRAWGLGIENGLFFEDGEWRDRAMIVLVSPDGQKFEACSASVVFPTPAVEEAKRRGFATTTAGAIIALQTGCDPADPHTTLTLGNTSRKQLLIEALVPLFHTFTLIGGSHAT